MTAETLDSTESAAVPSGFIQKMKSLPQMLRAVVRWATANRLRTAIVGVACLISVFGMILGGVFIAAKQTAPKLVTVDMALQALDNGSFVTARELAQRLKAQTNLTVEEAGAPAFVMGAATAYETDETWSKEKASLYRLAARYLEEARDQGFPPGRKAEGLFLLGRCLYLSSQYPASRPVLRDALAVDQEKAPEIHRLLAGAFLQDANPRLEEALEENALYVNDRGLPAPLRYEGLLERAQILLRMNRIPECLATLAKVPDSSQNRADAIVVRGQVLMHEAHLLADDADATPEDRIAARQKYQKAIEVFRAAQGHDTLSTQATRKAMYLIGVCYQQLGDYRAALAQFARTVKLHADTPEGIAASFQEAELSQKVGRDTAALASYRNALRTIDDPKNFSNPWLTLDDLRTRMLTTYQHYLNGGNYAVCLQLSKLLYPLFPKVRALQLTAQSHRAWGEALLERASHLPREEAQPLEEDGRTQMRMAGRVYLRLADLQAATRDYPERLWDAASAMMAGRDYYGAAKTLRRYLKDTTRKRHPQALTDYGEALMALNKVNMALEAFRECIEFHPRDAAAFRARLFASKAYLEKGDYEKVEGLLRDNLNGEYLTPASKEWRDSLFALGELLHTKGNYLEAIRRLEEAVARYPEDPLNLGAKYLIADSFYQIAKDVQEKLRADLAGATRVAHTKRIHEMYTKALDQYHLLRDSLSRKQETAELTSLEKSVLRNCYFAIGDIEFAMGKYEASIKSYSTATNRYQNNPEVLEAYVRIANAYRRLGDPAKAKGTLEQARIVLDRMKPDTKFTETTNYTRKQWSERLDALAAL